MNGFRIFLFEWKHFVRSPFKLIALVLFIIAAIYGLNNGRDLYEKQIAEIERIEEEVRTKQQENLAKYVNGELVPEDRPWVDMSTPFWSIWFSNVHHYKKPSPAMVYSTGQAEQYGFYKRVTFWASPYDADMAEEISNPERLQIGTLDFSFVLIFLLPLLLLILTYNIKSGEAENGFLPLIEVQTASKNKWLFFRMLFYVVLSIIVITGTLLYGASLTGIFSSSASPIRQTFLLISLYLLFWSVIFFVILYYGKSILGNTIKMIGVWLLFAFVIPGIVHQVVGIAKPANLMTDLIDADRDDKYALYDEPDSVLQQKLIDLFPEISESPVIQDSTKRDIARNQSSSALVNELKKKSVISIEKENRVRKNLVQSTYWFNPVSFFQNSLNSISGTHYNDYKDYRDEIQLLIDKQIRIMVLETWYDKEVDKKKYEKYLNELTKL